jgi:hypothetical protein
MADQRQTPATAWLARAHVERHGVTLVCVKKQNTEPRCPLPPYSTPPALFFSTERKWQPEEKSRLPPRNPLHLSTIVQFLVAVAAP